MNDTTLIAVVAHMLRPTPEQTEQAIARTREALLAEIEASAELSSQTIELATANPPRITPVVSSRTWIQVAIAASVVFAAMSSWVMMSPRSVMAQAVSQMLRANTFRCVIESKKLDGNWNKADELLFSKDHGLLHTSFDDGRVVRIEKDDREHCWLHREGQPIAIRNKSVGLEAHLKRLISPLTATNSPFVPDTTKSVTENGETLHGYILKEQQARSTIWIDSASRLRRFLLEGKQDGQWMEWQRGEISFDVAVDASSFADAFGKDVRIVDPGELLEDQFALEKALYRQTQSGFEIGVHDVKRLDDDRYYMLLSFRPTNAILQKVELLRGETIGQWHAGQRPTTPGFAESSYALAEAKSGELTIMPIIGKLGGFNKVRIEQAQPAFRLFAHQSLWKEIGSITKPSIEVPLPEETTSSTDAIRSVYELWALLDVTLRPTIPFAKVYSRGSPPPTPTIITSLTGGFQTDSHSNTNNSPQNQAPAPSSLAADTRVLL